MCNIHKMRSILVCVLVVTCISAHLNTPSTKLKQSKEITGQFLTPGSRGNAKGGEKIEERDGNTYFMRHVFKYYNVFKTL